MDHVTREVESGQLVKRIKASSRHYESPMV